MPTKKGGIESNRIEGSFYFDPDDAIYQDHFPGSPVVPGSLVVHAFSLAGKEAGLNLFNTNGFQVENFRFKHFVIPGEYRYTMVFDKGPGIACALYDKERKLVSGRLI